MDEECKDFVVKQIAEKINSIDNIETLKYLNKYIELVIKKAGE